VRVFRATELAPWDRGIASITLLGVPVNLSANTVQYVSRLDAEQTFTVIDQTKPASVVVQAADSVGHTCVTTITVNALEIPLVPLTVQSSIDFLTHLAPFDSTTAIIVSNPNEVPVAITKLLQSGDASTITSDLTTPLIFQSGEKKMIHIRLKTALLGHWHSDFTLGNDTTTLAHITAIGTTTGAVALGVGTVHSAHTQLPEKLRVTVSAIPDPINLDTIQFELHYNGDLIAPSLPAVDCSASNPLCNYIFTPSFPQEGVLHCLFVRSDPSQLVALANGNAYFDIPFTTYITKDNSSPVIVSNTFASLSSVAADTGFVSVGNQCGDPVIRATMNNKLEAYLERIVPNPASGQATVTIISNTNNTSVSLHIIDQLGRSVNQKDVLLLSGTNTFELSLNDLSSGNYIVVLTDHRSVFESLPLQVVR
jgi:hypothetical protein